MNTHWAFESDQITKIELPGTRHKASRVALAYLVRELPSRRLVGTGNADIFATTGVEDGTVAGVTYTDFANLSGGVGDDIFNLQDNVTGNVDGGSGSDTFNLTRNVTVGGTFSGGSGGGSEIPDDEVG